MAGVYPSSLSHLGRYSVLSEIVTALKVPSNCDLLQGLSQSFPSPLPSFSWVSLRPLLSSPSHFHLVKFAVENVGKTKSLVPLLEAALGSTVLNTMQDRCKSLLLDSITTLLEVCKAQRLGAILCLFRDSRLCSDDVRIAEDSWKRVVSYLQDVNSSTTSVSLLHETISQAIVRTKARYNVALCLLNMGDVMLKEMLINSVNEHKALTRALQLRMALSGSLEMSMVEDPFRAVELMGLREFDEFISECNRVNCEAPIVENSAKWLLEILPRQEITIRQLCVLSMLAMVTSSGGVVVHLNPSELLTLLPYHISQMVITKIWGQTAVEKLLEWLISSLSSIPPGTDVYPVLYKCLHSLRTNQAFRIPQLWSKAILLPRNHLP